MKKTLFFFLLFQLLPLFMKAQTQYISTKINLEKFETIKNFILEKGDTKTYRNSDNNPHYTMGYYEVYLVSDTGQKNINNDSKVSDFNELVIQYKDRITAKLTLIAVRNGDLISNKQWLSKSMKGGNVYVQKIKNITVEETEDHIESFFYSFIEEKFKSEIVCGDLWRIHDVKPKEAIFVRCTRNKEDNYIEAIYKVKGKDVAVIENLLVKKYGMGKLNFVCCHYECHGGIHGRIRSQLLSKPDNIYYADIVMGQ